MFDNDIHRIYVMVFYNTMYKEKKKAFHNSFLNMGN